MKKSAVIVSDAYLPKKKTLATRLKTNLPLLLMILPGFLALLFFHYKPIYGLLIAFKNYKFKLGVFGSPWAANNGMEHFIRLFGGNEFAGVLGNTLWISLLRMVFGWPSPIILALLLNEIRCGWFKKLTQTLTYIPHFFSWVVLAGIFRMMFSSVGPVNSLLGVFGFEPIPFYSNNTAFLVLLISTAVWQALGSSAVVYIAALSGVDESLYEAAYIDGASKWKQVLHITLPSIMGTITTVTIMNLANVLNAGFDQVYNMYNYSVYDVSDILDTYSLRLLADGRYEIGAALSFFKSFVGMIFVLGSNWFIKKISKDEYGIL
ncbi:MAG: sugar ABC transporter permease [Clostridia bacterium]|nr:sugar ABC transporter permease [Clostridia bacterium]